MLRLFLITAAIITASIVVFRSCFLAKQPINPGITTVTIQPVQPGSDTPLLSGARLQPLSLPETGWIDELLVRYLNGSGNTLIRATRESGVRIKWMQDRVEDADTAVYMIYHIGHDMSDENGEDPRFVTDGWVYIDTLKRKLYEYDLPADSLIAWKEQ